jgi:hypothetical protein
MVWIKVLIDKHFERLNKTSFNNYFQGTVRLKDISNCPKILDLIWQKGIQKKPELRPSMKTIFKVMQTLNSHINKAPLEPIVEQQRNSPPK